jgi:hypothetical protein
MATNSADVLNAAEPVRWSFARFADRWIFVFTAALFVATTLAGFVPESIGIVMAVKSGLQPLPPPIVHLHAVLMGSWLLLLLTQTILMATGRQGLHRTLGIAALVLVPAMALIALPIEVEFRHKVAVTLSHGLPPGVTPALLAQFRAVRPSLVLWEVRYAITFPILVGWALWVRRKDPQTHKRLMILATLAPLAAATDRVDGLIGGPLPMPPLAQLLYPLLLVVPLFVYDLTRLRRVPRAYGIWFAVNLPFVIAGQLLAGTSWWEMTGQKLLGMPDF